MSNIWKSLITLTLIIVIQMVVYAVRLKPMIFTWGATDQEIQMPMAGDDRAPYISSTRAITINAPPSEVWKWLTRLGADRGGFFSYSFIEKALGYEFVDEKKGQPENYEMKVGRLIPTSIDEEKSIIKYNFPVVYVEPGKTFVLENWGAFQVQKTDQAKTRLIVRTHGQFSPDLLGKISDFFMMPPHYIMERKMMMGIKERAEAGASFKPSSTADILWFLGLVLSAAGIILMIFIGRGPIIILLAGLYAVMWLWPLLILDPKPAPSLTLLALVGATMLLFLRRRKKEGVG